MSTEPAGLIVTPLPTFTMFNFPVDAPSAQAFKLRLDAPDAFTFKSTPSA